jgi:putative glycerol-1-phosphate prenyltransferase
MNSFYQHLKDRSKKHLALLIDPDGYDNESLGVLIENIKLYPPDLLLVGGSLLFKPIELTITELKLATRLPVFIFPGNSFQLCDRADGILFLSLISGRNPEFLIGNHVLAAPHLSRLGIEVIPTGYMLIENGPTTSVEYMSATRPIPGNKPDIAVATAMAGEMLGLKALYMEAGSGAARSVGPSMVRAVRQHISLPLMVGGGIRSPETALELYDAGADMIVVGNALEKDPSLVKAFCSARDSK